MIRTNFSRDSTGPEHPIKTLVESKLPMQVDCVSWNHKYKTLAIGAYELDENDTGIRKGFIYLIELDSTSPTGFNYAQQKSTSGVLDLKWEPVAQKKLAVATSNSILIYQVDIIGGHPMLEITHEVELTTMALFFQWMNDSRILFSDSEGSVSILEAQLEEAPQIVVSNQIHEFLVWIVHYNPEIDYIFSGADDGKFFAFQTNDLMNSEKHFKQSYEVGVTSITTKNDLLAIGSYDEKLRIYTMTIDPLEEIKANISIVQKLEIDLGGAVWRTIWLPPIGEKEDDENEYKVLVGAARNGVQIVSWNRLTWTSRRLLEQKNYLGSLAYGVDVTVNKTEQTYTVASCYFDNHMLHIWEMEPFKINTSRIGEGVVNTPEDLPSF